MPRNSGNDDTPPRSPEAGFSLVEVMAALVILAIAMTAVFATFTSQQKSFTVQGRVAEMQQNLRQAVEHMSRDIRLAGYGIPDNITVPNNVIAAGVTSMRSLYAKDNTTGPDEIYLLYLFDMDANQPPTTVTAAMPTPSAELNVASTTGFIDGDLVLISNGTNADLFEVTQVQIAALKLQHNPGSARDYNDAGGHSTWPAGGYGGGTTLAKARFLRYYIDSTDPAHPTLMVDRMGAAAPQPLADDIEDMQFEYGLDTSAPADGVVDSWTPNPTFTQLAQVRQVRLQFIARTRLPEAGWAETRPALSNRAAGATPDGYRRRIYDIVIDVRNPGV